MTPATTGQGEDQQNSEDDEQHDGRFCKHRSVELARVFMGRALSVASRQIAGAGQSETAERLRSGLRAALEAEEREPKDRAGGVALGEEDVERKVLSELEADVGRNFVRCHDSRLG